MHREMVVRCPNCGNLAKRLICDRLPNGDSCPGKRLIQTECVICDYFMGNFNGDQVVREITAKIQRLDGLCPYIVGHSSDNTKAIFDAFIYAGAHEF